MADLIPSQQSSKRYSYKAFISYCHDSDHALAQQLKRELQRFAKPFYRVRAFKVFLDQSNLGITAEGLRTLQTTLDDSEYLILLASPGAVKSYWVNEEVCYWLSKRDNAVHNLLIILAQGDIQRSAGSANVDWETTNALPKCLAGKLLETPIWLDMTWARESESIARNRERFQASIAMLASPLHGRNKEELYGEERKQQGRLKITVGSALTAFAALIAFLGFLYSQNAQKTELATANRLAFESESLRSSDIIASAKKALEASRRASNDTTWSTLLSSYYLMDNGWLLWRRSLEKDSIATLSFSDTGEELLLASNTSLRILGMDGSVRMVDLPLVKDIKGAYYRPGNSDQILVAYDNEVLLWSLRDRRLLWLLPPYAGRVVSAVWSGNGERILTTYDDGVVSIVSANNGQPLRRWKASRTAALSSDGRWVALSSKQKQVWIETVESGEGSLVGEKLEHPGEILQMAFSPDGRFLAVAFEKNSLRLWRIDPQKLEQFQTLDGHLDRIYSVQFSPDSSLLVSASDDGSALVWRAQVGAPSGRPDAWELSQGRLPRSPLLKRLRHTSDPKTEETLEDHNVGGNRTNLVNLAAFSPRGSTVAAGLIDGSVAFWFLGGDVTLGRRFPEAVYASTFIPQTSWVASAVDKGRVYLWNPMEQRSFELTIGTTATSVAVSHDGKLLIVCDDKGELTTWRAIGSDSWKRVGGVRAHQNTISSCSFSPDDKSILTAGLDGQILLWTAREEPTQVRSYVYDGERHTVWSAQFSRDGRFLVAAGELGKVYIYAVGGKLESDINTEGHIVAISFDATGRRILTAESGRDSQVRLWSRKGNLLARLKHPVGEELSAALFSQDGTWIISATITGDVRIWDVGEPNITGRELLRWQAHTDWIHHLALSSSGDYLMTSSRDGIVRQWPISVSEIQQLLKARIEAPIQTSP